jgi:hypothetical protein
MGDWVQDFVVVAERATIVMAEKAKMPLVKYMRPSRLISQAAL